MKSTPLIAMAAALLVVLAGCGPRRTTSGATANLLQARRGYSTRLTRQLRDGQPPDKPPQNAFMLVDYPSSVGSLKAYVSIPPAGTQKHPAIIWIFGGFDNGIGATAWESQTPDNDQSASAFRNQGIITMYPSLRGGNDNPGFREGFYGEVDDVISAAQWLAKQPYIDPKRIYLGGHSTGGTLALLVAESTGGFRAVFSFGPVDDVRGYGPDELPFDLGDNKEGDLRAPILWLNAINRPTFIFEGSSEGNIDAVREIARATQNPNVQCFEISGKTHFSILSEITPLIAKQIVADTGPDVKMAFPGKL